MIINQIILFMIHANQFDLGTFDANYFGNLKKPFIAYLNQQNQLHHNVHRATQICDHP